MFNNRRNNDRRGGGLDRYMSLYDQNSRQIERLIDLQREILNDMRGLTNDQHRNTNINNTTARTYYDEATGRLYINGIPYRLDYYIPRTNINDTLWQNFENLYSNVVTRPTNRQILDGTRNVIFSQIQEPLNTRCPISLEQFDGNNEVTQILGCGHIFHPANLSSWFERNVRCPVCRFDIRNQSERTRNEESKEEDVLEENQEPPQRNSIPPTDMSNNLFMNDLTNLTETILTRFLNPSATLNNENSRISYDASRNEIVFQGFYQ